jgi:hypothetical protein
MKQVYSIVGTNHCSERAQALIKAIKPGTVLTLVREPGNKFDKNAVAVHVDGERVGYIPKNKNVALCAFIDQTGQPSPQPGAGASGMGMDDQAAIASAAPKFITGKFTPSPNSAFPQVEVGE